MNTIIENLIKRKSVRAFEEKEIPQNIKELILNSAFQAPTAGNQMLYSIIDVTDPKLKNRLSITCDNQPFIAKAPMVLIFVADCRKWFDAYRFAGLKPRNPGAGDILLAIQDAIIAAQNTVIAAQSLGIGSCYIGDILENAEEHIKLLKLDDYVIPISMVVYGYPTKQQTDREKPRRFEKKYIVHENSYKRLTEEETREMFKNQSSKEDFNYDDFMEKFCNRKYMSDFSKEMTRSSEIYLKKFIL